MLPLAAFAIAIPLFFGLNPGQAQARVVRLAAADGYTLELSDTGITFRMSGGAVLRMNLPRSAMEAAGGQVRYRSVFRGVDLAVYERGGQIEYDWILAPGGNPEAIALSFSGAAGLRLDKNGDLVLSTRAAEMRHSKPRIYQTVDGVERPVEGAFRLAGDGRVGFRVGRYDKARPLVIDPKVVFSVSQNFVNSTGMAMDASGNIYFTGNAYCYCGLNRASVNTIFVTKVGADGTLKYTTYLGAVPTPPLQYYGRWQPLFPPPVGITVDAQGNAYVTGTTSGANFPAIGTNTKTSGGNDVFVMKLDPNGVVKASALFGGSQDDFGNSIALSADGYLYVAGTTLSTDFPTTPGAFRRTFTGSQDVFLMKLSARLLGSTNPLFGGSPVVYSTYLDAGASPYVALDSSGNAYVEVTAGSASWPTTPGVFQPQSKFSEAMCLGIYCSGNAIVAKMNSTGSGFSYLTYYGGSGDVNGGTAETAGGLAVDASGSVYITGGTASPDLPVSTEAFQTKLPGFGATSFVAKISPDASKLIYSTYLGGTGGDYGNAIALDASGNAYVAGGTGSMDFPIVNAIQNGPYWNTCYSYTESGMTPIGEGYCGSAAFLTVLNAQGSGLLWSTYLGSDTAGGVALDSAGNVYVAGGVDITHPNTAGDVVKIAQDGNPLQFPWQAITNGASFNPGSPAAGGLATLFVPGLDTTETVFASGFPLPATLAGITILVGGTPAPILAVAPSQVNFQVPFEATAFTNVVEVRYNLNPA